MESNFNNRDFEQFVKQNADQYRMFPSEKVWDNINTTLHTRRRWYGIGLTLLLLTTGVVTWVMLLSPSGKKQQLASNTTIASSKKSTGQKEQKTGTIIIAPAKSTNSKVPGGATGNLPNSLFLDNVTTPLNDDNEMLPVAIVQPEIKPLATTIINQSEVLVSTPAPVYAKEVIRNKSVATAITRSPVYPAHQNAVYNESYKSKDEDITTLLSDNKTPDKTDIYPLSIESVVNSYQIISKRKRLSWQIYFLPTVSYRRLAENKPFIANTQQINGSSPLNYVVATDDVNNVVTHKPDIGLELGFNIGYPMGKNVKLTAGLQLNVSKYDIKAYPYQPEPARLALTNDNGSASVSTVQANYRNFESYTKPDWLSNFYISASLPVGLEVNVTNTRKTTYLGIGGTIQPTYILGDRAYLISTDFKNYAEVPSLIRKWNVSTSFEVFAGYTTGKIKWKIGPQVRYQLLSSFEKRYPVKEHLIDFGLKVGVMLK
jgi:hypothetical protein